MTVKVSKPAINVREELADLRKPTGIAGEAMLRAETPQEQFQLIGASRKNMLLNGDFSIWQRGTSGVTGYASSNWKYAADRWKFYTRGNTGVGNFTKSTTEIDGVSYDAAYFQLTTGNSVGAAFLAQYIEGVAARGKHITFSFWYEHISGEYPSIRINGVGNNASATLVDGWNSITTKSNNTFSANGLYVGISIPSANPCSFKFTHAQVELGKVATPFEHRSYGEELALCQRFFTRLPYVDNAASGYAPLAHGSGYSSNTIYATLVFPTMMRAAPTVTPTGSFRVVYGNQGGTGGTVSMLDIAQGSGLLRYIGGSSFTIGQAAWISLNDDPDGGILMDAEL